MLKALKPVSSHEDYFIQRYQWLMGRALQLTNHNSQQSEDLVHDAFIQFTLKSPDLLEIENADAYLNRMLRNMYLSNVRRSKLIQDFSISIAAYDSAEISLRSTDPRDQVKVQDELRQICQYACARKKTSKAGSTLILRFFHSYYPSEIAQILRTTQRPIYDWLKIARREAKLYLVDPASLKFISNQIPVRIENFGRAGTTVDLLNELRGAIFTSKSGQCLRGTELENLYRCEEAVIDCATAAHIVSCYDCLDRVNRLLGLPPLAERFLTERLGKDTRPPDGSGTTGSGGVPVDPNKKQERRLKEVIEHRPQELRILANGFLLGSQHISGEFNKQSLGINIDEPVGFIEVFSEQWIRLLFFDVEQPINGAVEQRAHAAFKDGRSLSLNLSFRGNWPVLDVVYHDPTFELADSAVQSLESEAQSHADLSSPNGESTAAPAIRKRSWSRLFGALYSKLRSVGWRLFLRPATVTAILALLLLSVALFVKLHQPAGVVAATELLARSAAAEETVAASFDTVLHRTFNLEIRNASSGDLVARQKVEVWQNAAKGLQASRLFNERNELIAGQWNRADGSRVVFNHGGKLHPVQPESTQGALNSETLWQMIPAAKYFSALPSQGATTSVEEKPNTYLITYQPSTQDSSNREVGTWREAELIRATLTLSKGDLHAIEQTFVIAANVNGPLTTDGEQNLNLQSTIGNRQIFEYHFVATSFERRSTSTVAPAVFEPDSALLGADAATRGRVDKETFPASPSLPVASSRVVATTALELDVLQQLNQVNALLGEQINLGRTPEGRLSVDGVVEKNERKVEILRALSSFKNNSAIQIDIVTVDEALQRQRQRSTTPAEVTAIEVSKNSLAVEPELRAYFLKRGVSNEGLDQAIRGFAETVLDHSFEARRHALALKQIAERFSAEDLRNLDDEARGKWRAMINEHARAFAQETISLRRELEAAFPNLGSGQEAVVEVADDADLVRAASRLFTLGVANDEGARRSFSLYAENPGVAPVKTAQFWRTLRGAESLAQGIGRAR